MEKRIDISGIISDYPVYDSRGNEMETFSVTDLVGRVAEARKEGATSLLFAFDSDGGDVEEGFRMASYIETLPEPTIGVAVRVFSITNVPYFACDERKSEAQGMFMLHQAWVESVSGNSDELRFIADRLEESSERMASYISYRTGVEKSALLALMGTDRIISREEAEKIGFLKPFARFKAVALASPALGSIRAESYSDYPQSARDNARRALEWLQENDNPNDCATRVGLERANQLDNGEPLSVDTIERMVSFFARHEQNKDTPYSEGCGKLVWDLWGGGSARRWAEAKLREINNSQNKLSMASLKEEFQAFASKLGFTVKAKALSIAMESGEAMEIETENEGELLGASVNMEDGEYAMEDGRKFVIKEKKIEEIVEAKGEEHEGEEGDKEKEEMLAQIASLQAELQAMKEKGEEEAEKMLAMQKEAEEVREQMQTFAKLAQTNKRAPNANNPMGADKKPGKAEPAQVKAQRMAERKVSREKIMAQFSAGTLSREEALEKLQKITD